MTKEKNTYRLPDNWILTTIGDISILINGDRSKNYPSSQYFVEKGIPFINAGNITNGKIDTEKLNYITKEKFDSLLSGKLIEGDIIYCLRGSLGKNAIVKGLSRAGIASSLVIVRLLDLNIIKFVYYFFNSHLNQHYIHLFDNGTAQPNLSAANLSKFEIPFPPLAEQKRIVEKIEELFSELDKAQESLLNAKNQVEIYRQVVLKDAFKGKLTKQWRINRNIIKYNFILLKLKQLVVDFKKDIVDGPFGSNLKSSDYKTSGIPVIKIQNVNRFNFIEKNINFVTNEKYKKIERHSFKSGDIVLTKLGEPLGKSCIIPKNIKKGIIVADLVRIRVNEIIVNNVFLNYYINSPNVIKQFEKITKGTTRQRVNLSLVREIEFLIPEIDEQSQIVQEIEYRFTLIDNLEKSIEENLKRVEIFRQTILKKAFTGNLVLQNENDEPSSILLQRVKEELKVYKMKQKEIVKNQPKRMVFMDSNKTVREILEAATEPMEAKDIWQKSIHKDDIEKFYEELKQLSENIEEIREGKISKIWLKNEN